MDADAALAELMDVSPQVEAAVLADRAGTPLAHRFRGAGSDNAATALGSLSLRILESAEQSRTELGREPVVQAEIAAGTGNVFVVTDEQHVVIALTTNEPTVGLVFYDLKTALRVIRTAQQNGQPIATKETDA